MKGFAVAVATMGLVLSLAACEEVSPAKVESGKSSIASTSNKTEAKAGGSPSAKVENGKVLAKVDGEVISVGDFEDRINKQSPYIRARYNSVERKKEFLQNMIRFEILAKEAQKRGYDKDPEVTRTMKQVMIQKLTKEEFDNQIKEDDITEEEMKKYYDEHLSDYNKPEQVRISSILVKDKETADKVLAEAQAKAEDRNSFRDLAKQYSIDEESKNRGGDLRYFSSTAEGGTMPQAVSDASFALQKVGDMAGPVQTDKGFQVIKLTGKRRKLERTFDQVKRQIQSRLYRERRAKAFEDYVDKLKTASNIVINEDLLGDVKISPPSPEETQEQGKKHAGAHGHDGHPMMNMDKAQRKDSPIQVKPASAPVETQPVEKKVQP